MNTFETVILVASGKGGVGKSTIASNLAVSLAREGFQTGLLDADLFGPSIPLCMGLTGYRSKPVIEGDKEHWDPVEKYGVKVMSLAFFMNPNDPVIWRGPMATKAITQLVDDTRWGFLNFLVVDMPPGTGDIPITVAGKFPDASAVVVITPQKLAMADGRKAINMFRSQGISIKLAGIIENMSWFTPEKHPEETYFLFGRGGGQTLAEECDTTLIAQIPLVADVCEAGDSGQTIYGKPHKQILDAFANLTDRIIKIHSSHVNA